MFYWTLMHPKMFQASNIKMLVDLMTLILKVAEQQKPYITHIGFVDTKTGKEVDRIVCIWAGAGEGANVINRVEELKKENERLKEIIKSNGL
jgi:hypothetical protein